MNPEQRVAFDNVVREPEELDGTARQIRWRGRVFSYQLYLHTGDA